MTSAKIKIFVNLIVVVMLAVVMVGWVVFRLAGSGALDKPYKVTAEFAASGGVFTNQEVTYRGVLVGQVGELALSEDGVRIELVIEPEWEGRIPADVEATVRSKSAVGEQFVNLTPGAVTGSFLEDGDVIPRERTSLPVDFQALLSSLDRVLADVSPEQTRRLISNLAGGLEGRATDIGTILNSLGELSAAFESVAPEQRSLLRNATETGTAFLATKDEFSRAIRAADAVFAGLGDEPEEMRRLFAANDRLAREGIALLARRGDDLASGIEGLADFVGFQLSEKDELIKSLEYTPQFLNAIEEASVPWVGADGRRFYRIRVGLILDNVPSTWPCKYELPLDWERMPHVRDPRTPNTNQKCLPSERDADLQNLMAALEDWSGDIAEAATVDVRPTPQEAPTGETEEPRFVRLRWPLEGPVTAYFTDGEGEAHEGIDIAGEAGADVVAAAGGRVVSAGLHDVLGNVVVLEHQGDLTTVYAHLQEVAVTAGDTVGAGDLVGLVGCTGVCSEPHLHFQV
ncbi:MAG TPA: MCE family protein, partial [Actinomycetota bacterium]|nr:MCE family protein [Actinomycetota bacterium]